MYEHSIKSTNIIFSVGNKNVHVDNFLQYYIKFVKKKYLNNLFIVLNHIS